MAKDRRKSSRAAQMPPEARRKQLLRAGITCFVSKGIGATKHADLARACDISVPAVFSYFSNREVLVNSILEEVGNTLIATVIDPALARPDASSRLAATAPLYISFTQEQPDYVKVWLMWSMHFAPEIQSRYARFETQVIEALAQMIREAGVANEGEDDIRDRARMILASSSFLAKMVFDGVSEARRANFVAHVLEPLSLQR